MEEVIRLLRVDEAALALSHLHMFPYFDAAHYLVSSLTLREQPGVLVVSRCSPLACWFSSMLYCFGGAVLSGVIMAEAPVAPLANSTNILLASFIWYLVFYCPGDLVYSCTTIMPVRLVLTAMKEVTRTWKVLGGVTQASRKYKDSLLVMIAVGWTKGAGGGLMSNFEQLVRGVWKPETNELLKMTYPTKVTLMGAVLFSLQKCSFLPLTTPQLMLLYTAFTVTNKVRMMLGSSSSPFTLLEWALYQALFARPLTCSTLSEQSHTHNPSSSSDGRSTSCDKNGATAPPGGSDQQQEKKKEE